MSGTPETDAVVSRFRKGETSSDGLILTMQKIERERDELRRQVQELRNPNKPNPWDKLARRPWCNARQPGNPLPSGNQL